MIAGVLRIGCCDLLLTVLFVLLCSCTFDMSKVEIYSVLVTLDAANRWQLDGYKHHSVTGTVYA